MIYQIIGIGEAIIQVEDRRHNSSQANVEVAGLERLGSFEYQ